MDLTMIEPQQQRSAAVAPAAVESIIQTSLRQNKEALITLPYESIANSLLTTTTTATTTTHHHQQQLILTTDKNEEIKTSWPTNSKRMEALLQILHSKNSHDSFRLFVDAVKSVAAAADLAQKLLDEGTPYLPPEILSKVFTYLTPKDLLITRLVSPKWKELSSPTLFSKLAVVLQIETNLEQFLRNCARNLEYEAFFKNFKTFSLDHTRAFRPYEFGEENLSEEQLACLKFFTKFGPIMQCLILGQSLNESFAAFIFTDKVQQTLNNLETLVIGAYLAQKDILSPTFSIRGMLNLVHLKVISPGHGTNRGLISLMEKIFQSGGGTLKSFKLQGHLCIPPPALPAGLWKPLFSRHLGLLSFDIGECTEGLDSNAMKDLTFPTTTTRDQTSQLVNLSFLADVTDFSQVNFHRMLVSHSNSLKRLRINHYACYWKWAPANLELTSLFPQMARLHSLVLGHESFLKDLSFLEAIPKLKVLKAVVWNERQLGFGDTDDDETGREMAVAVPVVGGQEEAASPQYKHHGLKSLRLRAIYFRAVANDFAKLLNTFPQLENLVFNHSSSGVWYELSFDTVGTLELIGTKTEVVGDQQEGDLPANEQIHLKDFREYYGGSFIPRLQKGSSRLQIAEGSAGTPGPGAEARAQKLDAVLLVYRDYDKTSPNEWIQKPVAKEITALLRQPVDEQRGSYKSVNIVKEGPIPTFLIIRPLYYAGPQAPHFHIPVFRP